jgi:hypothetical protein
MISETNPPKEPGVRINTEATKRDFEPALLWLAAHVGGAIDQRVGNLEKQAKRNIMLASHFENAFPLEYALVAARRYRRNTGRLPIGPEFDRLYSFAVPAMRIHQQLPTSGRKPFEGKLQDFVNGTFGARPFAYEVGIATHLMQKGWDVEFSDLCGLGQFDLLARAGSDEIEIECKTSSGDTGRKVHQQEVNRLADILMPFTEELADVPGCHLIKIIVPDRLAASNATLLELAELARASCQSGEIHTEAADVAYRREMLPEWPDPATDSNARDFFERLLGGDNLHIFFHVRRGHAVVAVNVASKKPDKVVAALSKDAVTAAKQCSGTRPAIVAMQLIDPIEPDQLGTMLYTSNGLHKIAHSVFKSDGRAHVDSIMFTVPQRLLPTSSSERRMSAPVMVLQNDKAKFNSVAARSVFRAT